jgi:uncharacterized protein
MFGGQTLINKEPPITQATKTVGLISDTHVPKQALQIPRRVFEIFSKADYIIHAGDLVELAVVDELEQIAPVLAVHGNMDNLEVNDAFPSLNSLKVFGWKIGVIHNADIAFGLTRSREIVQQNGFNVLVSGHSHTANITWENGVLYINPGSATSPSSPFGKPSVGLLKLTNESITPQIIEI